jgi:uncharacterized protein
VNDEFQLQVRPKDSGSSLSLIKVQSGLIARGRREAATLEATSSSEPTDLQSETRRLAEEGDADSQHKLGHAYFNGIGVPQDEAEAVRWWRKAADAGNTYALFPLGFAYYFGRGAPQDYAEAVKLFSKDISSVFGCSESGYSELFLGNCYFYGQGAPQDYTEAARWWREAVDSQAGEDGEPQHSLGSLYANGQGVTQDYVLAHMWFNLSASKSAGEDQEQRAKARDDIAKMLSPQQLVEAQRMAREWRPKE